jgi:hypothetical protein
MCTWPCCLVVQRLQDTRTARGTLAMAIGDLRRAEDPKLHHLACGRGLT